MKKYFAIILLAGIFTACKNGDGNNDQAISEHNIDTMATNNYMNDTTGQLMGDSTTSSGTHGQGSGSRVGGGVSGGAQGQSSDSTKR